METSNSGDVQEKLLRFASGAAVAIMKGKSYQLSAL